jgi:hypothetical protein
MATFVVSMMMMMMMMMTTTTTTMRYLLLLQQIYGLVFRRSLSCSLFLSFSFTDGLANSLSTTKLLNPCHLNALVQKLVLLEYFNLRLVFNLLLFQFVFTKQTRHTQKSILVLSFDFNRFPQHIQHACNIVHCARFHGCVIT